MGGVQDRPPYRKSPGRALRAESRTGRPWCCTIRAARCAGDPTVGTSAGVSGEGNSLADPVLWKCGRARLYRRAFQ